MAEAPQDYNASFHENTVAEATANANEAYQQGMLAYNNAQLAFQRAQQAWKETMDKAGLTGMYEGQWTMPTQQWFAQQFGSWGAPTQGQQTLQGQQQQWQQAFDTAAQYGQYYGAGQNPAAGTQTLQGQQQQFAQGLQTQQEARAAQAQQQAQAQSYLQLLSQLRGPADWFKYQQVLGSTPNGMRDLVAAAMGQYIPGGGATTGMQPQAANLTTMMQQVAGQPVTWTGGGSVPQGQLGTPSVYQYNPAVYGQQQQQAQTLAAASGQPVAGQQAMQQQGSTQPNFQALNAQGGGTNTMGAQPQQYNLPAPNQIAPQTWNNLAPSQKELFLGAYEDQGWHKPDVEALFAQSLPKYASNAPKMGSYGF